MRVRLQLQQLSAQSFERLLFVEASLFLLADQTLALLPLLPGSLILTREPLELKPRGGEPRSGSRELLGQLPLFVIERERVFLLDLLLMANALQFLRQSRGAALQLFDLRRSCVGFALPFFDRDAQLAQFALERQRPPARLLAARNR